MERVLGKKVNFSNLLMYSLSILTSCQFTNGPNCEISTGVFQNREVCGQAFPLLPSPSPFYFFCSRSNFRAITGLETLATQARKNQYNSINGKSVSSISTDWSMQKISIKSDLPIFIYLSIDYSGRMWARAFWKWCCKSTWAFPFQWRK